MWRWFELLSFKSIDEIKALKADQVNGKNPRDIKIELAKELIARFHDDQSANLAEENFINQFQKKNIPDDIEEVSITISETMALLLIIPKSSSAASKALTSATVYISYKPEIYLFLK